MPAGPVSGVNIHPGGAVFWNIRHRLIHLHQNSIPVIAIASTILETSLGLLLLVGYKTNYAALGAAALSLLFAVAMAWSFGIKEPLDYSVFAFSAGAFLLATMPSYKWSIDQLLTK